MVMKNIMDIIWKGSPNFWKGRDGKKPVAVVIHVMAGTLPGTDAWFANPKSQVSAHYGVGKNGEIHQYVKEEDSAWHVGRVQDPVWKGYDGTNPNRTTVGIEHEGSDLSKQPDIEIRASALLVRDVCLRNGIPIDREHVIGHYEIFSGKPSCPGTDKTVIDRIVSIAKGGGQSDVKKIAELVEAVEKDIDEARMKILEIKKIANQ